MELPEGGVEGGGRGGGDGGAHTRLVATVLMPWTGIINEVSQPAQEEILRDGE
jgi:hypothetical protein